MPEGHVGFDLLPISKTNQKIKNSVNSVARVKRVVNITVSRNK
jgi:hypothetical protein